MTGPIIIDTDPGVDDALALMLALASGLPVQGITTVYGNGTVEQTTTSALTIVDLLQKEVKVYTGSGSPLSKQPLLAECHGEDGLCGLTQMVSHKEPESLPALEFMRQTVEANPGLTLVYIGPTTNLVRFAERYPELVPNIGKLLIMGAVIGEKGNVSPYAEFNVYNDPDAFEKAMALPVEKVLFPADVCRKVVFSREDFDRINHPLLRDSMKKIVDCYVHYYTNHEGFTGGVMYDLLTIAYLLDPSQFACSPARVWVDVTDTDRRGETKEVEGEANCLLARSVNASTIKEQFFTTLNAYAETLGRQPAMSSR